MYSDSQREGTESVGPEAAGARAPEKDGGAAQRLGNKARAAAHQLKETSRAAAHEASVRTAEAGRRAREAATEAADARRHDVSERLQGIARAFRETSDRLRDEDDAAAARVAEVAARGVENVAGYLHNHDVREMVREAEDFARRHPSLFIGAAIVGGFLAGRFLHASTRRREREEMSESTVQGRFDDIDRTETGEPGARRVERPFGESSPSRDDSRSPAAGSAVSTPAPAERITP
jgi:hypothetical protein